MYGPGWHALRSYPVEGDSAQYELWRDGELFVVMWLDRIDLDGLGADRTRNARVMVNLYERHPSGGEAKQVAKSQGREKARPFHVDWLRPVRGSAPCVSMQHWRTHALAEVQLVDVVAAVKHADNLIPLVGEDGEPFLEPRKLSHEA
jgi:hypothetical protein